jgi:putative SOS response-associated peptidase YedK
MCYSLTLLEPDTIQVRYAARFPSTWEIQPSYYVNAFSIPACPVLPDIDKDEFHLMYWGLIPYWVKTPEDAERIRLQTMNARSETLFEKPSFRMAIKKRRCLIPTDGFFEWRQYQEKNYPYYIHLKHHEIFSIAGIWDIWKNPETKEDIWTFSVITCDANPLMAQIHNKKKRMPVILPKGVEMTWLDKGLTDKEIQHLLQQYPVDEMQAYTISKRITSTTQERNHPEVLEPYTYPELPAIQ